MSYFDEKKPSFKNYKKKKKKNPVWYVKEIFHIGVWPPNGS